MNNNYQEIKKLKGHSGCFISLCRRSGGEVFVRKSCHNEYSSRLKVQVDKQAAFSSDNFRTPNVLSQGWHNGGYFVEMEYINGIQFIDYLLSIDLGALKTVMNKYFDEILGRQDGQEIPVLKFHEKINELESIVTENIFKESISILRRFQWTGIRESYCHGDLTFENIIVKDNDIYIIDFLDSFVDTKYIDISKALQDLDVFWSLRGEKIDSNLIVRFSIIKEILRDKISSDELQLSYHLLLLNILRIVPYVKDVNIMSYLKRKTEQLNFQIMTKEY